MEMTERNGEQLKNKPNLIFTYGTLKRGFPNHPIMERLIASDDAVFLGTYRSALHLPLVCGPHGVPFLLHLPSAASAGGAARRVLGELYAVSDRGMAPIDDLEGVRVGNYERRPIRVVRDGGDAADVEEAVEAEAYFGHRSFAEAMWRRNGRVGFGAYTEEEVKGYVKRSSRPKTRTFLEDIQSFVSSS